MFLKIRAWQFPFVSEGPMSVFFPSMSLSQLITPDPDCDTVQYTLAQLLGDDFKARNNAHSLFPCRVQTLIISMPKLDFFF